ncbi:unnamed protein product [Hyaloperonospora brassicae]|uniref:Uncharacterized protein n=1 Tax=Hyaloperonospora brassicae TaxID=162125 RepID=A0AAV0UEG3_HYABA|nr:unnamed protein product [Hyaloperonospora brassicae]
MNGAPIAQTHDLSEDSGDFDDGTHVDVQATSGHLASRQHRRQTCKLRQIAGPAATQQGRGQQIQLSGLFDRRGVPGGWLQNISELVFTAADCRAKAVIGNEDTELDDSLYDDAKHLQLALISPEVLLSCTRETLDDQLNDVYASLNSCRGNASVKLSYMTYLISLSKYARLADAIVNSPILELTIRMLAQEVQLITPDETILSMLCLGLAVQFRSTTVVALSSRNQLRHLVQLLLTIVAGLPSRSNDKTATSRKGLQSRSRALACLGELLLYMLTKEKWELPMEGVDAVLVRIEDLDVATRCYAVRALCNMLIHTAESSLTKLMSGKVVLALIRGLLQWRTLGVNDQDDANERRVLIALRTTTTEALAQVLRHLRTPSSSACLPSRLKRSILLYFAQPAVLNAVWQGVDSPRGSIELKLASLNVINAFLDTTLDRDRKAEYAAIQSSRALLLGRIVAIPTIQNIVATSSQTTDDNEEGECRATLRAKSLIMLHLGLQQNQDFLTSFVQNDALTLVEQTLGTIAELLNASQSNLVSQSLENKLSVSELYLMQCVFNLCKLLLEIALELGADCVRLTRARGRGSESSSAENGAKILPISFQLLRRLLTQPNCRQQFLNYLTTSDSTQYTLFLRRMAKLLMSFPDEVTSVSEEPGTTTTIACSVSGTLLLLFQSATSEADDIVLVDEHELLTHLLPVVVKRAYGDMESNNEQVAANCLRLLHVLLLDFDYGDEQDEYKLYDSFIRSVLLPNLSDTLTRRDAMVERVWSLSSELLFGLLSSDSSLVSEAKDLNLVSTVVNLLCVPATFTSLPTNATQLVQILVDSADVDLDWLFESGIARSMVIGLTLTAKRKQVDESVVDLVAILLTLLQHQYEKARQPGLTPTLPGFTDLVACGPLLLQFCACGDEMRSNRQPEVAVVGNKADAHDMTCEVAGAASRCLVLLSRTFGEQLNGAMFAHDKTFASLSDEGE